MPPTRGLKGTYPATFCEWVVGTTIESALASRPKKEQQPQPPPPPPPPPPKQREIIKVEVTTDDETEEDSLKVTYPRSGRSSEIPAIVDTVVKKVRFEVEPVKSALKKTTVISSESEGETSESAESSKSAEESSEAESSESSAKKPAKSKKSKRRPSSSDSGTDSDPHPILIVSDASSSEAESGSEDKSPPPAKSKKKEVKKTPEPSSESSADDEASDATNKGQSESEDEAPKKDANKKKQESANQTDKKKATGESQNKSNEAKNKPVKKPDAPAPSAPIQVANEDKEEKTEKTAEKTADKTAEKAFSKKRSSKKKSVYPEAFLAPHPRRPQLIEPIRAEVVQTERVIETPEDPPPNAYFDPVHGVLRVYHGPVYGNSQGYALYPRRDAFGRPLPMGMPHPTQNPFYHGFGHPPQQSPVPANGPITQGMPVASYHAMCPPPGLDRPYLGSLPYGVPPVGPHDVPLPLSGSRGAFSTAAATVGSPLLGARDKYGSNNVAPGGVLDNPYIPKRNRSMFSTYGSREPSNGSRVPSNSSRAPSNGSHKKAASNSPASQRAKTGFPSNDGAGEASNFPSNDAAQAGSEAQDAWGSSNPQTDSWNNSGNGEQSTGWGNSTGDNQAANGGAQPNQSSQWGNGASNGANGWDNAASSGGDGWGNETQTHDAGGWDNCNENAASQGADATGNGTDGWPDTTEGGNQGHPTVANNVMPCSYPVAAEAAPAWGDPTAAASTGGQYNEAW